MSSSDISDFRDVKKDEVNAFYASIFSIVILGAVNVTFGFLNVNNIYYLTPLALMCITITIAGLVTLIWFYTLYTVASLDPTYREMLYNSQVSICLILNMFIFISSIIYWTRSGNIVPVFKENPVEHLTYRVIGVQQLVLPLISISLFFYMCCSATKGDYRKLRTKK
jgi:hypothetical protein